MCLAPRAAGLWLRYAALQNCARLEGVGPQSKERKGSNFAIWQPCLQFPLLPLLQSLIEKGPFEGRKNKGDLLSLDPDEPNDRNFLARRILKSNFPAFPPPPPALPPPPTPPISEAAAEGTPKGLEMFLLQRAKALQQANPALKALADLQGKEENDKSTKVGFFC